MNEIEIKKCCATCGHCGVSTAAPLYNGFVHTTMYGVRRRTGCLLPAYLVCENNDRWEIAPGLAEAVGLKPTPEQPPEKIDDKTLLKRLLWNEQRFSDMQEMIRDLQERVREQEESDNG